MSLELNIDNLNFSINNIHEKITQFWLAERGVQLFCNTSANLKHECKLQMISDWLKTQKKPTRTNQIRDVSKATHWRKIGDNTRRKMAGVFSKQRFGFASEKTIEELKKISKNPNTVKSASFWLNVWETWCKLKNTVNKIEENEPEKLKLLETFYAEVKNKNGDDYEPDSLRVMIAALDRHLNEKGYKFSIIRDRSSTLPSKV